MSSDFLPKPGGIAEVLDGLVRSTIDTLSWQVYTSVHRETFDDEALPYAVTRLEVKNPGERRGDQVIVFRKVNSLVGHLQASRRARSTIDDVRRTFRPDLVLFGCWDHAASYWSEACRNAKLPYAYLAHGMEVGSPRGLVMRRRRTEDLQRAGAVIANSTATASDVLAIGVEKNRVVVINPGVCSTPVDPISPEESLGIYRSVGIGDAPFILAVGRFIRRKGFDLVISAFCALAGEFPSLHLVIAGEGPERSNLASQARASGLGGRIHLSAYVMGRRKTALLQGCEFVVSANREVPGEMEGFGLVFREAAFFGKASIGGRNGGVPEAVIDGKTGLLVDTSDGFGPLAIAMRSLLSSPEKARDLGSRGRSFVREGGMWEHAAVRYRVVFDALVKGRAGIPEGDLMPIVQ